MSEQPIIHPVAQPQDHRSATEFTFQSSAGPITVPKFKKAMSIGFVRKNRKLSEDDMMFTLLEESCSPDALAKVDQLDIDEWQKFATAWQDDSGTKPGESSGS